MIEKIELIDLELDAVSGGHCGRDKDGKREEYKDHDRDHDKDRDHYGYDPKRNIKL
jgi:hypothetical protein